MITNCADFYISCGLLGTLRFGFSCSWGLGLPGLGFELGCRVFRLRV